MNDNGNKDYYGALDKEYVNPYKTGELKIVDSFYCVYVKRMLDIIICLIAVIITLPINIIIGIITFFDVGTPMFFVHKRPGLGEEPFTMVKFRNMTNATDENGNLLQASDRVTNFGKFVRATSLDELLQFWLILQGKMSIIGPRPLLMIYLPRYNMRQHKRHAVKPGLECPMPYYLPEGFSWEERLENDVWYAEHVSFKTDIIMMIRLIKLVFNSNRSKIRGTNIDIPFENHEAKSGITK